MNQKQISLRYSLRYISLIIFILLAFTLSFVRFTNDLNNLKVKILFQDDPTLFFYNSPTNIPKNTEYVILKDITSLNTSEFLKKLGNKKLGILEFNDSEILAKEIARMLPETQIINVHYIKPEELQNYNENTLFKRLWRAVIERSIDLIIVPRTELTEAIYNKFINYFQIEEPSPYIVNNYYQKLFGILLGIFVSFYFPYALFGFLLFYFSYPIFVSVISTLGTIVLFFKIKDNFLKFFAFFTLGIFTNLSLYDFYHVNNIEVYRGVKVSLGLLPLILLFISLFRKKTESKKAFKIFALLFLVFGIYYIIRSGNNGFILSFEKVFRETVENLFIIRPRTKELLFYPFLLISVLFTTQPWKDIFEIFGSIALVSTFNTFCHIRAPLFINIYRELITFLIALSIYGLVRIFFRKGESYDEKNEDSSYNWSSY
ncbi:DUF5693 family protein [Thermosipho atlanticus]|uniref:Uncharacterized protein n=1 Tax=Thermosipho atlanticus DSM 15807 TaxID=1123380 RepID=A0A1M5TID5_9BACT|nr:DUF5693 family protein [Thermosipho atlanticus]SHH50522.1 hypothetical protein SAMN02745199_1330 [Thermosipho atlanticus DSM 15807]